MLARGKFCCKILKKSNTWNELLSLTNAQKFATTKRHQHVFEFVKKNKTSDDALNLSTNAIDSFYCRLVLSPECAPDWKREKTNYFFAASSVWNLISCLKIISYFFSHKIESGSSKHVSDIKNRLTASKSIAMDATKLQAIANLIVE